MELLWLRDIITKDVDVNMLNTAAVLMESTLPRDLDSSDAPKPALKASSDAALMERPLLEELLKRDAPASTPDMDAVPTARQPPLDPKWKAATTAATENTDAVLMESPKLAERTTPAALPRPRRPSLLTEPSSPTRSPSAPLPRILGMSAVEDTSSCGSTTALKDVARSSGTVDVAETRTSTPPKKCARLSVLNPQQKVPLGIFIL